MGGGGWGSLDPVQVHGERLSWGGCLVGRRSVVNAGYSVEGGGIWRRGGLLGGPPWPVLLRRRGRRKMPTWGVHLLLHTVLYSAQYSYTVLHQSNGVEWQCSACSTVMQYGALPFSLPRKHCTPGRSALHPHTYTTEMRCCGSSIIALQPLCYC